MKSARRSLSVDDYEKGVLEGDRAVLGRALTLIESENTRDQKSAEELLQRLLPRCGNSRRIGISGIPGVGKSTLIESFGSLLVSKGLSVAVLAIDPSSQSTGGSILGDKTRMNRLATEPKAFIRPSPSAGTLGGVARKTRESIYLCEAAGYEIILVETVGVGQSETLVAEMVDLFLLLMLPGAGDELQGIKRGVLELADVIAVNKADGENRARANLARNELQLAMKILRQNSDWIPPVLLASALSGEGLEEIWREMRRFFDDASATGKLTRKRQEQQVRWMWSLIHEGLASRLRSEPSLRELLERTEDEIRAGIMLPPLASQHILHAFFRIPG